MGVEELVVLHDRPVGAPDRPLDAQAREHAVHRAAQPLGEAGHGVVDLAQAAADLLAQVPVGGEAQDGGRQLVGCPAWAALKDAEIFLDELA